MNVKTSCDAAIAVGDFIKKTGGKLGKRAILTLATLLATDESDSVRVEAHPFVHRIFVVPPEERAEKDLVDTEVVISPGLLDRGGQSSQDWSSLINQEIQSVLRRKSR